MKKKTEHNIFIAFLLNLIFSIIEFIGGAVTGSIAIISDSIHDLGDAASIGVSFFLERLSKHKPDEKHTYGYKRYSVLGSIITTIILIVGSIVVIYNAVMRLINPISIHYDLMIIIAVLGVTLNTIAAFITKDGDSMNQKAVSLHMIEDVMGWIVVLIGAIVMRFTNIYIIDPIMSILVSIYIFIEAIKYLKQALDLFLEKTPSSLSIKEIEKELLSINGVVDVHHIHVWSIDGINNYATMHIVTDNNPEQMKSKIREHLEEFKIVHSTLELETTNEKCSEHNCEPVLGEINHHHHHHH